MATRIVIAGGEKNSLLVACYYDIPLPQQIPQAADQARVEAVPGSLAVGELQSLRDGALHEYLNTLDFAGKAAAQIQAELVAYWSQAASAALADYLQRYKQKKYIGVKYDDIGGWA